MPVWSSRLRDLLADTRGWVWGAVVLSLLVVGSISLIHVEQVDTQRQAIVALDTFRRARIDLAKGFLHTTLAGDPSSPFDGREGWALLMQAIVEFEEAQQLLESQGIDWLGPEEAFSAEAFSRAVFAFHASLLEWKASNSRGPAQETRLRNAFYELELQADQLDSLSQSALHDRQARLNRDFVVSASVAGVLLLAICCGLYLAGSSRRRSEAALRESERHRLEQEEQLQQTRRLEAIGRLAGGVAHDLNNLLTPILGYGEMLLGDLPETDPRRSMVSEMFTAASRAAELVAQLLAFGRQQPLEIKPVDLNEAIQELVRLLRRTIRENVDIDLRLSPETPAIGADAVQVGQVILNLAVNAEDAMPNGGTLTISSERVLVRADDDEASPSLEPGMYALLTVSDTGRGMDPETKARVFEPFFTTKEPGEGTGLGLATVHGIVRQHHGDIVVDTKRGSGTTFRVYLPSEAGTESAGEISR